MTSPSSTTPAVRDSHQYLRRLIATGPIALDLARGGTDCDELVRSYHPFSEEKVRAILAKYEVTDKVGVKAVPSTTFDLQDSAFDKELKQIVANYFKDTGRVRTGTPS